MDEYLDLELTEDDIKHLLKSEEDIEKGRVYDFDEIIEEWNEKYGG